MDYDFKNDKKQERYEQHKATEAVTLLTDEIAVLRTLLEGALQESHSRSSNNIQFHAECLYFSHCIILQEKYFPLQVISNR